jgi:hypothetical protein
MPDPDDLVQNDVQKAKDAYQSYKQGSLFGDMGRIFEQLMWAIALLFLVGMIASLPFVGSEKLIPGRIWIGVGSTGIVLFGFLAVLIRFINHSFSDVDSRMAQKFNRR